MKPSERRSRLKRPGEKIFPQITRAMAVDFVRSGNVDNTKYFPDDVLPLRTIDREHVSSKQENSGASELEGKTKKKVTFKKKESQCGNDYVEQLKQEKGQLRIYLLQKESQNRELLKEMGYLKMKDNKLKHDLEKEFGFLKTEAQKQDQQLIGYRDRVSELEQILIETLKNQESSQMGNDDLEKEIEELKGENGQLRNAVIDVESQNNELSEEVDNLTLKASEMQDELNEIQPQFNFLHGEVEKLDQQLMDSKDRVFDLEAELHETFRTKKIRNQDNLKIHIEELQEENEQLRSGVLQIESEKHELSEEVENLRMKEGELQDAIDEIQPQFVFLNNQVEKLYQDLMDSKERVVELEGELENKPPTSEEVQLITADLEVKERRLETTKKKLRESKKRIQHLEEDLATELRKRNHTVRKNLSEWMEKLQEENSLKDDFIQFQNQHVMRLTSYLKIAKQQIEELDQRYQEKRELLHKVLQGYEALSETSHLVKDTPNLGGDVKKLEREVERLRAKALEYSVQLSDIKNLFSVQVEEGKKKDCDIQTALEEFKDLLDEATSLEKQLEEAHSNSRDLEEALEKEKKTSKDEITRLQQQLTSNTKRSEAAVAESQSKISEIEDQLKRVQAEKEDINRKCEETKRYTEILHRAMTKSATPKAADVKSEKQELQGQRVGAQSETKTQPKSELAEKEDSKEERTGSARLDRTLTASLASVTTRTKDTKRVPSGTASAMTKPVRTYVASAASAPVVTVSSSSGIARTASRIKPPIRRPRQSLSVPADEPINPSPAYLRAKRRLKKPN